VGSGTAVASVSVVPLSAGLLTDVLVSSGQRVEKGDVLALLDDEEQIIARDRAARTVDNLAIDEARLAKLFRSRTTTEVELIRARASLADARLALREAELTLARKRITAPISGVVGLVAVDKGNYVSTQTEIVTIDDRSTIILEFWVPERFASQVSPGQTLEATAQANPSRTYTGTISGIGSRVENDSRTLPVQARVDNMDDSLRPGMSFNLSLSFAGQRYPAVDPLAIQWDSKGSFVWRLVDDKAQRVPVQIIQRNPESVLVASELAVDDQVITEGLLALRPGAAVRVQGGTRSEGGTGGSGIQRQSQPGTAGTVAEGATQAARP
jgi:RND family efflux transporter MFP subunit